MSNRDSMGFGDLLPQDVVQIFNEEKHGKRGHKKRSHSLGRALGWLKGRKRKEAGANGQSLGLGPALDLALDGHHGGPRGGHKTGRPTHAHGNSHALPKRDDDDKTQAPLVVQENVFIEASRPKHLEDLHTEALEGLKMMQEEELNVPPPAETNYGMEYQDCESTISTRTVQTEGEGGGFVTDSTLADTTSVVSVQSSASTRSSRSGLTRQGSTFRPLNSGKRPEKAKRRRQRKTVVGIPQHVQKELGLDRVDWKLTQTLDEEQLYNGDTDNSPTTEGPQHAESQQGDNSGLRHKKFKRPLDEDQVERLNATHAGHRDDLATLQCLGPDFSDEQRPRSLAVPWMTTANSLQQEQPSPVMSMSPQAPYMSKIIHNAVLPPSIDVVEISSRRSRSSLRTVSKSSLLLSSPTPSRPSSRASSSRNTSSRASNITSASRYNPNNQSDSSCWSNSESSDTLVSDSSTISSGSTRRQKKSRDGDSSSKEDKVSFRASGCNSNGRLIGEVDAVKKEEPFVRSLSVMKPKKAPPPPSRSYSLHNKMKRRSRDLAEVRVIAGESSLHRISTTVEENDKNDSGPFPMPSSTVDSPGYNADTSGLDDSTDSASFSPLKSQPAKAASAVKVDEKVSKGSSQEKQENKPSKVISPSSGYSSQDATSPQICKPPHSSSPRHKRGILAKLQKLFPGSTSSAPSLLTQPEAPENDKTVSCEPVTIAASVRTLRELFNIPPPPKVHAPPAPPPEVWAHSKRSFELLLGPPAPDNIYAIIKKNPKDRRQQRQPLSASADGPGKSLGVERKHKNPAVTAASVSGSPQVLEKRKVQESVILTAQFHKENSERLAQKVDVKEDSKVPEKGEKVGVSDILNGMLAKAVEKRQVRLAAAVREAEEPNKTSTQTTEVKSVHPPVKQVAPVTSSRTAVSPESSWPPPPPPMTQVGLGKPDEIDFPLPPPPLFGQVGLVMPVQVPPPRCIPGGDSCATVVSVVTTEAEPHESSSAQGIGPPPLNIPPPPPYTAPPPPVKAVSPPAIQKFCLPPREISPQPAPPPPTPPPLKEISPPPPPTPPPPPPTPPPPKEFSSPPPKVSIQAPKEFSPPPPPTPPPPKEFSSPPPKVSIQAPKEFSPPPPTTPPPPKEISPPPPIEVSSPPPKEASPPPPKEVSPPPPKEVSPPTPKEVSPPPPKVVSPPPPKEVSPPPPKEVSPPPPKEVSPPPPKELSPAPPKEVSPPTPKELSPPPPKEVPPMVQDAAPPLVIKVSPLPSAEIPAPPTEEVAVLSSQGIISQSSVEVIPVSELNPPESIPPPPQLSEQDIDIPQENVLHESEISLVSSNGILTPPLSIPPPPNTDGTTTHEVPPSEVSMPKAPETPPSPEKTREPSPTVDIPLPVRGLTTTECESSTAKTENPSQELNSDCVVVEEPLPVVTPSLLQMVQLRSANSGSPESSKAPEQSEATEITMRKQQHNNQVQISSANGEAPQKPIRRSLIIIATSPTSTSPPVIVTSPPILPKSQSPVAPSAASSTSPTKKSPPAMAASPSMNLQEAIRLRTAARSKESPSARLSLKSPTSPMDFQKSPRSPSSTASFIFSKSNKPVVIETRPVAEAKASVQNKLEVSSVTKVVREAESLKKAGKVPPPVAKKPKSKAKDSETREATEQTAGQEAQQESIQGATEKTNGTSGPAEEGETSST